MAPPVPPTNPEAIAIQDVDPQGSYVLVSQAANLTRGNMFLNDGTSLLHIYNGAVGGDSEITIWAVPDEAARTGTSAASVALPNASIGYQVDMPNGQVRIFGPFRQAWWNQTSGNVGYVYVSVDAPAVGVRLAIINY